MSLERHHRESITPELARRLAAYIPVTLARQILRDGLPAPGRPRSLMAATLFSDISGFTAMSEELASDGPRGAEELNRVLLAMFTAMIGVIHDMGGAVSHFYGDAMSVYFPDGDGRAAVRALACAQMMQQLMATSFDRVVTNRPLGKSPFFHLTLKIGLGYGRCQELVVGDPERCLEFVLTGQGVDEAAAAEKRAQAGQVVASRAVLAQAGRQAGTDFRVVGESPLTPVAQPLVDWTTVSEGDLIRLGAAVTPFVPRALYERLQTAGAEEMGEHRPVTTLFVQFEYTGDEDESSDVETEAMGRQLQQYYRWVQQTVARFGSQNARLNRVLTGDKGNQLHILFGAPVAPDAPEQAIRCALALQRERPGFIASQRIGLAVGKVFASPVGSASRREYTVVGDVVNLSARLAQICEVGAVLMDEATADRVRDLFNFESLPPVQLKGKQTVVMPHRVQGEQTTTTQLEAYLSRWRRPMVGRDSELDLLLGGMDAALRGVGGVAAVFGPAGVGKTRLLAAGVQYWLEAGGIGLLGVCHPHTADTPFSPWRGIWHDFFGLQPDMDEATRVAAVVERTRSLVPGSGDDVALWGEVLGILIPQTESLGQLTAEARQARFFSLVRRCFQAAAADQPLLIVLEGLHWADQSSLALIDDLTLHLKNHPIFMAISFRPRAELSLETLNRSLCLPIIVSDLAPKYGRQLLQQRLGSADLPVAVEQRLGLRDREGRDSPVNPLFLEEGLKVLMEAGVVQVNGRLRVNEELLGQMQVPDTIHGILLARLDRLPPPNRDLLQVASVIGRQFALEPLDRLTPKMARQLLTRLLDELSAEELTRLLTTEPDWVYLFQHALTHEVAYESLPYRRRQKLHAAVADWLATRYQDNLRPLYPVLAYHYSRAGLHEEGLRYALAAADDARDIFANQEAVELYKLAESHLQALGVEERWETAVDIYLSRGEALRFIGDFSTAVADVEQAISLSLARRDWERAARAHNLMAELKCRQARYDEAQALTEKVITDWAELISSDELARAYQWLGTVASSKLDHELALSSLKQAEEICVATNNKKRMARVLEGIAYVHYGRRELESALEAMQRGVQLSRDFSVPATVASALNNIALIQSMLGLPKEAVQALNEAIELVQGTSRNFLAHFLSNKAVVLAYLGQFPEALNHFEEAMGHFIAMDDEHGMLETHLLWGYEYCNVLGRWDEARYHFEQAQRFIDQRPHSYPEEKVRLLLGYGQVELEYGETEKAESLLKTGEKLIEEMDFVWWRPVALYLRALLELSRENRDETIIHLLKALKTIGDGGCPDYRPLILLELAQLEKNHEQRITYLEQCVQAAQRRARSLDRIYCFRRVGELLVDYDDASLRSLGETCLAQARQLE